MRREGEQPFTPEEEGRSLVKKGDIVVASGTMMTEGGVEAEVLRVYANGDIKVRLRQGKHVGKETMLMQGEYEPTGKTTAEEQEQFDKEQAEIRQETGKKHAGAHVGDEVIARETVMTGQGTRAIIKRFLDRKHDQVEVEILEGKYKGRTTEVSGDEWEVS